VVGYAGSPICAACADMTLTRSNIKVMVTGLLNFRKLHFPKSISSARLPRSSKLMADYGGMEPNLQLDGARFLNFLLNKLSHESKLHGMSTLYDFQRVMVEYAGNPMYCVC